MQLRAEQRRLSSTDPKGPTQDKNLTKAEGGGDFLQEEYSTQN